MPTIEDRISQALNPGTQFDWLKQLAHKNPDSPHIAWEYSKMPLLFESIFSTEKQLQACLFKDSKHKPFQFLSDRCTAESRQTGVIPLIHDFINDNSAHYAMQNAELIQALNKGTRLHHYTLGQVLQSHSRANIAQSDYNYITNNLSGLIRVLDHITSNELWGDQISLRNPFAYKGIMYDKALRLFKRGDSPVDPSIYLPTGAAMGVATLDSQVSPRIMSWLSQHDMAYWHDFNAYGQLQEEDIRLIIAPRHIPWQLLLPASEGMLVPLIAPIPIPLIDDVAWVCSFERTDLPPDSLPILRKAEIEMWTNKAIQFSYCLTILSAIASIAKVGKGNDRIRWCASPYNSTMISHILSE